VLDLSPARFCRIVVVRVLYHCHQCVDAASGGIRDWNNGRVGSHEHSGAAVEPLDSLAIPPQHDRCCRDGQFCDGRFGSLLPIDETARRVRSAICPGRCRRRVGRYAPHGISHWGWAGKNGSRAPAGHLGRHGRPLRDSGRSAAGTVGQPDMERLRLDNPILIPDILSFLDYRRWKAEVQVLKEFHLDVWPDNIPLLYYSYHIMVGLGTIFIAVMGLSALFLWRRRLYETRPLLWALMLAVPFPYIATTAGWMTAELGRQPWLIHGLMRTIKGAIPKSAYSPINPSSVNNPFPVETCGEGCSCCLSWAK